MAIAEVSAPANMGLATASRKDGSEVEHNCGTFIRVRTAIIDPRGGDHGGGSVFIFGTFQDRKQQKKDLN